MLSIFELKPIIKDANGEDIIDLTYPSIRYTYDPYIQGAIKVNDFMAMRPDLVSRSAYSSTEYWDLILKYNGISNPFSIGPDDYLLIPALDDMSEQMAPVGKQDKIADSVRQQYIDISKKAKSDPRIAEQERKRRAVQKEKAAGIGIPSKNNLPPNIAEVGDREITIKGGKVYFGADISRNKQECEKPLSKAQLIAKLIKNRLK